MNESLVPSHDIDQTLMHKMTHHGRTVTFKKGETAFSEDDLLHHFYIILSGRIKVFQINLDNAREQTIFILSRGDMFDTISMLDGKRHEVMNEGLENGEALRLPMENVRKWLQDDPDFNRIFFPYLARQMRAIEELATDITLQSTSQRLIKLILRTIDPLDTEPLLKDLSHTEIANLIGTVRHVVDRHLKEFKKDGIIDIEHKRIIIKDLHSLQERLEHF